MCNKVHKRTISVLSTLALLSFPLYGLAEELTLDTIEVSADTTIDTKAAVLKKQQTEIQNELIRDTRDLVRYVSDIGISDNGRHLKGFSIRGVEGNRVGISIDGVNLPDFEENSLYARYGNFNSSRLSIDTELVQQIEIARGANSFNAGSGALGGDVNYRTLDAQNLVQPGRQWGMLLRGGYASKNKEWVRTVGVGYVGEKLDAILIYSQRTGHELRSSGRGSYYDFSQSQHPDPSTHRFHSYLGKLNYQINANHRIGININGQTGSNYTNERSYTLYPGAWREADDQHKRLNGNVYYAYTPNSPYLALFKADIDYQHTNLAAVGYKGGHHWKTQEKQLDEIFDRRMKTKFTRFSLQLDSQPLYLWGEHHLGFRAFIAERRFENINHDIIGINTPYHTGYYYTIQYPVKTRLYSLAFQDHIHWYPKTLFSMLTGQAGIRYDHEKLVPQSLNALCSKACTAEGKPDQNTFSNWTGFLGLNAQLNDTWSMGYKLSTAYRTPTASEMYFTFTNAYGTWKSNPSLKPERSLSHTLSLQGQHAKGQLDISVYHSRYRHFLLEQENIIKQDDGYGHTVLTPMQQMVNINRAQISGIEIKGKLNLSALLPVSDAWKMMGGVGYSQGKLSNGESLLSIQPLKTVIGLDFEAPNGTWGIFSRLTYLGAKRHNAAKIAENSRVCLQTSVNPWYPFYSDQPTICTDYGYEKNITTYKYLNKSAYLVDLFGFYKPSPNITLRGGIYNLFNRKYHTWDALRGINAHSTTNAVDRDGIGLTRFQAPGRNFAASIEMRF
ncbi:TonB-dependent hemoglobin/transferrin/lactoferrin family receptor [Conservatibacter flavescens]|uniref:TonB-dependent hemoglobin/transferrin/lactoferrin family receptor n=1 Tax=Conservatibacter flavescens TaxID=28161 RepID=A0A2M8RZD9_9PAST|nr:TonB-dependent hemoglobin/transferrin/lactoferrin family receptor [Conservatibacter flavescens]PJG84234.1 TonB-dependent hemoglobin/transferrin/lactoferrin family receptor [Conservatibacter flavescens]